MASVDIPFPCEACECADLISSDHLLLHFPRTVWLCSSMFFFVEDISVSSPCFQWLYYFQYAFHFIAAVSCLCGQWKDADELSGCMNLAQQSMLSSLFSITTLMHHLPPYLHGHSDVIVWNISRS
jgi:hypothetical protein